VSTPINDGGPAFPNKDELGNMIPGMTLRDWFAGQALAEIYTARDCLSYSKDETIGQAVARNAYTMADAMLAAREGTKP
jgi:hypothetical protein